MFSYQSIDSANFYTYKARFIPDRPDDNTMPQNKGATAFTTDAGLQWTPEWSRSAAGDKLLAQIVRWSMRPSGGSGKLTATFEPLEGKMRVVATALDDKNEFLNFLTMTGTAVGPDLKKPLDLQIEQTAPGRYVGTFSVNEAGSYFVTKKAWEEWEK